MIYILIALAVTIIICVLLFRFTIVIMGRIAGNFINKTHRNIEYIINTRKAPQSWAEPFVKKLEQFQPHEPHNQRKLLLIRESARKACIKKLDKLIKYTHNTSIIQDEETRQVLLEDLATIRAEWVEQEWDTITE